VSKEWSPKIAPPVCRDRQLVGVADGSGRAADLAEVNADAVGGFVKKNINCEIELLRPRRLVVRC